MQENTRVKKNWDKVRRLFLKKSINQTKTEKYKLLQKQCQIQNNVKISIYQILNLMIFTHSPIPNIYKIKQQTQSCVIDTTGTWVWQAEQMLTYFLLKNQIKYKAEKVLQLGAGSSGLAGILYSMLFQPQYTLITDGRKQNIQYLQKSIISNGLQKKVKAKDLLWGSYEQLKYDLILLSDCLFFQAYHKDLIITLKQNLAQNGITLFVNPKRGKSMNNFLDLIENSELFACQFIDFKDQLYLEKKQKVKELKGFNEQEDIFYFIEVKWKKLEENKQKSTKIINNQQKDSSTEAVQIKSLQQMNQKNNNKQDFI